MKGSPRWRFRSSTSWLTDCMICDLYKVIDRQLGYSGPDNVAADFAAELVSVLPPRGHALHNLAVWQDQYRSPDFLRAAAGLGKP